MKIETLLTEAEIAAEFADALEARDLPDKFFYWSPFSVRAWQKLARNGATESGRQAWAALLDSAPDLASRFDGDIALVSLGAGEGTKDLPLAQALAAAGAQIEYFPVDASQILLEAACVAAEQVDIETLGIKADISSPAHLVLAADASESPKLYLVAGNTMGGQDPHVLARQLRETLREGDWALVDAEVYSEAALAERETDLGRAFAGAPLHSYGVQPEDGEVHFELKRDERTEGLYLLARYFHAAGDLRVTSPERDVLLQRGERVSLNFSYIYTPAAFRKVLRSAGLKVAAETRSADGRCVIALCSR
jgi:uncharacterized SAM-dependent methyltransferase